MLTIYIWLLSFAFHHPTKMKSADISSIARTKFFCTTDLLTFRCGKAKEYIGYQTTLIISIIIFVIPRLIWGK